MEQKFCIFPTFPGIRHIFTSAWLLLLFIPSQTASEIFMEQTLTPTSLTPNDITGKLVKYKKCIFKALKLRMLTKKLK